MRKIDNDLKNKIELLSSFNILGKYTTNEAITNIYRQDLRKGHDFLVKKGWKHYVHLNKLTTVLEKENKIRQIGKIKGPTGKTEKVWTVTGEQYAR